MHLANLQLVIAPSAVDRDLFQFRLALDPVSVFELDQMRAVSIDVEQDSIDRVQRDRCLLYTSPSPRDATLSRMPSSA